MQKVKLLEDKMDFRAREAYRTLRTNVEYSGENIKVVALTSCMPNEGKSTTSYELAKTFARQGKKTLLIDADLRKSVMAAQIVDGPTPKLGLVSFLAGKEKIMNVLTETDQKNLYLIFAGYIPPNPTELLSGKSFQALIEAARKTFDMIIIDTPPIGSAIDGAVVAKQCDGCIVVIKHASISYKFAKNVKQQLESIGVKVIGCVLNMVGTSTGGFYGSYYSKYSGGDYGYYGKKYGKSYDDYYGIGEGLEEAVEDEISFETGEEKK